MEELINRAKRFLDENLQFNEIELTDGSIKVRIVRQYPFTYCYYQYQTPTTGQLAP